MNRTEHYFDLATRSDTEAYFDLFAPDAVVEDDGNTYHGMAEIRSWRTEVPLVQYDVLVDDGTDVSTEISGDFPGSPVTLRYHFEFAADDRIEVLRIGV